MFSAFAGVLDKWNAENPKNSVRVGDRIVKIGGEQLQGHAFVQRIQEELGSQEGKGKWKDSNNAL